MAALGGGLSGIGIGVVRHFFEHDAKADAVVADALENALGVFGKAGATISEVRLAPLDT